MKNESGGGSLFIIAAVGLGLYLYNKGKDPTTVNNILNPQTRANSAPKKNPAVTALTQLGSCTRENPCNGLPKGGIQSDERANNGYEIIDINSGGGVETFYENPADRHPRPGQIFADWGYWNSLFD